MEEEREVSIHDYLWVISRRRWIIILSFLIATATTITISFLITPIYEAHTTLWIEKRETASLFPAMMGLPTGGELHTQCEILKSRVIAEQVVRKLNLDEEIVSNPSLLVSLKEKILYLFRLKRGGSVEEKEGLRRFNQAVLSLQKRIGVEPIRNTDLIRVKIQDEDPKQSMEIANTLADVFVNINLTFERGEARSVYEFTKDQIDVTRERLKRAEEALKAYKERIGISVLGEEMKGDIQKIVSLETIYAETRTARQAAQVKLRDVRDRLGELNEDLASETIVVENEPVKDLKARLTELELKVSVSSRDYGERNPKVLEMQRQLKEARDELSARITSLILRKTSTITPYLPDVAKPLYQELMGTLIRLETEINAAEARESALEKIIKEYEDKLNRLPAKELELARLMRATEVNEEIYKLLLRKNEEARVAEAMQIGNIRIVDPAIKPDYPIKPNKRLNIMIGAILGLILGVGLAFFKEYLDPSIKTVEEVEKIGGLPIMGVIPTILIKKGQKP